MTERADGQVTWSDLGLWSGKMSPEHSQATKGETSRQSSKRSSASQSRKPPILMCLKKAGQLGGATTMKWEDDGAWLGECMMRNTGESPNAAVESRLSQILEATPPVKYSLSAKACQGILRRAERRGKDLPPVLKAVLLMQSGLGGGCDGGGKGALVQTEKSGTLGTGNDQTIFCMATQQGGAELRMDDRTPALTAAAGMSGNNQPVVCAGFKLGNSEQARSIEYAEEQSPTLNAECGGNKPAVLCLNDQGGNVMGVSHDVSGTLRAQEHGHQPTVLDMSHACDVIRDCGEVAPSLQARMGTGETQIPLTFAFGRSDTLTESDVASTQSARQGKSATDLVCAVDCRNFREGGETNGTLQAKSNGGISYNLQNTVRTGMIVRRLTPMECERLQGYPDGWTDIGEWMDSKGKRHKDADSPRYKALGNSIALPFWQWLIDRMAAYLPDGATMGSLFDGIGGFPLCWQRTHGEGTAKWASEIEEFPIAVTKKWFGED